MLTIRNAQLQALAEHSVREFRAMVIDLLQEKYTDKLTKLPAAYLERAVDIAFVTCFDNGFDRQGLIIEFVEALLKDDVHPMSDKGIEVKAQRVLREFRSREVYSELQALAASVEGPAAEIIGADVAASDPTQE